MAKSLWIKYSESLPGDLKSSSSRNKTIRGNNLDDKFIINVPGTSIADSSFINTKLLTNYLKEDANINLYSRIEQKVRGNIKIHEKLHDRQKRKNISKRSLYKRFRHRRLNRQTASPTKRLYRHPNLSYEDQKKLKDKLQKEVVNLNLGDTLKRRVQSTLNPSPQSYKFEFSSEEPGKHGYIPVLQKPKSTSVSEANNHNKSTPESSTNLNKYKEEKTEKYNQSETSKNSESHKNPDGRSENSNQKMPSLDRKDQQKEKNYINIQDHQRNIEMTIPSDIPEYDPSKIPYVEVPDYSDIREESLDAEDRRLDKKKMAEANADYADPETPGINSKKKNEDGKLSKSWMDENSDSIRRKLTISRNDDVKRKLESNEDEGSAEMRGKERTSQFESAIFDINEYRQPFNLDEFLKDDPIMKKLQLLEKETTALYGGSRKPVGLFNESESDNDSAEWSGLRKEQDKDDFDYLSKFSNFE